MTTTTGYDRANQAIDDLGTSLPATNRFRQVRIGRDHDLGEVVLARDWDGLIHLLVRYPAEYKGAMPSLGGPLECNRRPWPAAKDEVVEILDVVLREKLLQPTFISLIGEMLDRMERSDRPAMDELVEVVDSWRRTLERLSKKPSKEALRGLFGELWVARRVAEKDSEALERVWVGPGGGRHDFTGLASLEVKTLMGSGAPVVTINGLDQLDPVSEAELHLLALRIVEHESGETADQIASVLLDSGVSLQFLEAALRDIGFQLGEIGGPAFIVEQVILHRVADDFPGLRRSHLPEAALKGIESVSYRLQLDAGPDALPEGDLDAVIHRLIG